jgi:N6-adenosine-specific RNA methylase IME4
MISPFENLPQRHFRAVLADPPLAFATRSPKGEGRAPQHHYGCMTFGELATLPVASIAAPDCFLFLWIPLRSVYVVAPLMEAWGFEFSGSAFVWAKQNPSGVGWAMGGGYGTRKNAEVCWLGRRGKPKRLACDVRELIIAPRREHSRKPDDQYQRIERLCGGPYVELFARQTRPGWTSWGNEVGKFDEPAQAKSQWDRMWSTPFGLTENEKKEIPASAGFGPGDPGKQGEQNHE